MSGSLLDLGAAIGPYRVTAWLGSGGMGEVYRAHDPRLNRTVAIKILPTSHLDHARRRRRFETEQHALAALNHPNIVAVYDAGYQDGRPFIVTECLVGQTLRDKLESPISLATVLDYAVQMARGLAAAHARGILHRDLKPENVFVTVDGHIKLLDFGLARMAADDETVTETSTSDQLEGAAVGTIGYMSPEQVLRSSIDHRSDIFAFGIVLFEMLCSRRLFQRLSRIDTLHAIVHDELPETLGLDPRVPPFVASVLRRCLAKDPAQRFQSADDLGFALAGQTRPTPGTPPRSRLLIAAVATIALCGAVAASLLPRREAPSPSFTRLTFGRGNHGYARFAPDRTTVVYSAWWQGAGARMFSTRLDSPESRPLDLADADILSISPMGQMAVLLERRAMSLGRALGDHPEVPIGFAHKLLKSLSISRCYEAVTGHSLNVLAICTLRGHRESWTPGAHESARAHWQQRVNRDNGRSCQTMHGEAPMTTPLLATTLVRADRIRSFQIAELREQGWHEANGLR